MNKIVKYLAVGLVSVGVGASVTVGSQQTANAAKRKTVVVRNVALTKHAYKLNGGTLYTQPTLKKKAHNARNYANTKFYSYRSASVIKKNGKRAVYYYVQNKSGKVKGWIWRGYTVKQVPQYTQQKNDMNAMIGILHGMTQPVQDHTLYLFKHMSVAHPYNSDKGSQRNLSRVVDDAANASDLNNPKDANGVLQMVNYFKSRVSKNNQATLDSDINDYDDAINGPEKDGDRDENGINDSLSSMMEDLSNAFGDKD